MTSGVYAIINTTTDRVYVGSSRNIELRWSGWRSTLGRGRGGNKQLQADWGATHGAGFEFTVLEEIADGGDDELSAAEKRWIAQHAGRRYNVHISTRRAVPGSMLSRLQQVRVDAGLTVRMLAKTAGVSSAAILNAEHGRMTHGSTMGRLAGALGVHWLKLVSAEEETAFHEGQARLEARMRQRKAYWAEQRAREPKRRPHHQQGAPE